MRNGAVGVLVGVWAASLMGGCGEEQAQYAPHVPTSRVSLACEPEDPPPGIPFALRETLEGATFWPCPWPDDESALPSIARVQGDDVLVNGVPIELRLHWEGLDSLQGHQLLFAWSFAGYFAIPLTDDSNPILARLFTVDDSSDHDLMLRFAIDDGMFEGSDARERVIGQTSARPLRVIGVGTGDLQFNLRWYSKTDMDLHVVDPAGTEIDFGNMRSPSGGELDLDSYAACFFEGDRGRGNENIFWPLGKAPPGTYQVFAHMFNDCGTYGRGQRTHWTLTIVKNRDDVTVIRGSFDGSSGTSYTDPFPIVY